MDYSFLLKNYSPDEIAKYIRLSLEDKRKGDKDESESISNQRIIINQFIDRRGNKGSLCKEFIDDGQSGTNFDRAGWQDLMQEVEDGKIKVIITKNLSRLGRSNFECSYYMDYYLPSLGVRFMTVQEDVDTATNKASNEYAPLNHFMNEKYSRDLSKNIKNSKRVKQEAGDYIGSNNTPYGYKRDPKNKHHLIIDEYSASVVRKIYDWYIESGSQNEVRRRLYDNKILTPAAYNDFPKMLKKSKCPYQWCGRTIKEILTSETYIGSMVQHKYEKKNFRSKKLTRVPKEEWVVVPNKHEPIIDKATFNKVQNLINSNYHSNAQTDTKLLQGILYCHECQHKLQLAKRDIIGKDGTVYPHLYTQCTYYRKNRNLNVCSLHSNDYYNIEQVILEQLDKICNKFIKLVDYEKLTRDNLKNITTYEDVLKGKINKFEAEIKELDQKIEKIYIDRLDDVISLDTYQKISTKLEVKKENLLSVVGEIKDSLRAYEKDNSLENILKTKNIVKDYLKSRKDLNKDLILKMIDKIEIHEDKTIDLHLKLKPLEQII